MNQDLIEQEKNKSKIANPENVNIQVGQSDEIISNIGAQKKEIIDYDIDEENKHIEVDPLSKITIYAPEKDSDKSNSNLGEEQLPPLDTNITTFEDSPVPVVEQPLETKSEKGTIWNILIIMFVVLILAFFTYLSYVFIFKSNPSVISNILGNKNNTQVVINTNDKSNVTNLPNVTPSESVIPSIPTIETGLNLFTNNNYKISGNGMISLKGTDVNNIYKFDANYQYFTNKGELVAIKNTTTKGFNKTILDNYGNIFLLDEEKKAFKYKYYATTNVKDKTIPEYINVINSNLLTILYNDIKLNKIQPKGLEVGKFETEMNFDYYFDGKVEKFKVPTRFSLDKTTSLISKMSVFDASTASWIELNFNYENITDINSFIIIPSDFKQEGNI